MKLKAATRLSGHNGVSSTGLCMKIGELAKITETQAETIRFYEREGLLREPPRTEGNYRLYEAEHLERLALLRQGIHLRGMAQRQPLQEYQREGSQLFEWMERQAWQEVAERWSAMTQA